MPSLPLLAMTPAATPGVMPAFDVPGFDWQTLFPMAWLGTQLLGGVANNQWLQAMESLWAGALWMTQFAFKLVDSFTTPDLSAGGPMSQIYPATFAIGGALALVLAFVQIGFAAWQRNGQGVARVLVGVPQFGLAWAGMLGIGALLTVATSGLTQGLLQLALGSPSFGNLNMIHPWTARDGVDSAVAGILGICGVLLILAAIGYLAIMLVRAGALVLIIATSPIAAAGLVAEGTRTWFWRALRWFIAALMIAPLAALILGIGKKLTDGIISGAGDSVQAAVGQSVIGTVLVIIGGFAPLVLFRLLAFVDPGTSSGQSFRASLDAAGGLPGLLSGGQNGGQGGQGEQSGGGSGAATATSGDGSSSQGEADAAAATQGRLASAMGPLGSALGGLSSAGQGAAAFGADVLGAAGVGHPQPYFATPANKQSDHSQRAQDGSAPDQTPTADTDPSTMPPPSKDPVAGLPVPQPPTPGSPGAGGQGPAGGSGAGKSGGTGGGTGGGAGAGAGAGAGVEGAAAVAAL